MSGFFTSPFISYSSPLSSSCSHTTAFSALFPSFRGLFPPESFWCSDARARYWNWVIGYTSAASASTTSSRLTLREHRWTREDHQETACLPDPVIALPEPLFPSEGGLACCSWTILFLCLSTLSAFWRHWFSSSDCTPTSWMTWFRSWYLLTFPWWCFPPKISFPAYSSSHPIYTRSYTHFAETELDLFVLLR